MKRIFIILGVLLLTLGIACSSNPELGEEAGIADESAVINDLPMKIVSLSPSNTEMLFALGLEDRIVGVTDYCDFPPEAKLKPTVGGFSTPNLEKVIFFAPDLVLAGNIHKTTVIPELERLGLNVVMLDPQTMEQVLEAITWVGDVTGQVEQASQLVNDMKKRISVVTDLTEGLSEDQRPRVLYITWHDPLWVCGSETLHDELIKKAGGINVAGDITGFKTMSLEEAIQRNPQIIITATGHGDAVDLPWEWAKTDERLKEVEARKNGRVYQMNANLIARAGPRSIDGLETLGWLIHPELFEQEAK